MKNSNKKLIIEQLDAKLARLQVLKEIDTPSKGWIHAIRTTLNMSLADLGRRLKKTAVSVREIEEREQSRTITLNKLIEVGEALDMQFVYGFIPKQDSIEKMIERRSLEVAREVVQRTSHTMALEDQENRKERLEKAVKERAEQLKREVPKYLWR
ncbi:MAG: mobile mystery protein A [Ignavibacteriales bacterium]|nr:mobile mystery protein A [Ignavibacteriales bacterium]